jgi:hypothetical protein
VIVSYETKGCFDARCPWEHPRCPRCGCELPLGRRAVVSICLCSRRPITPREMGDYTTPHADEIDFERRIDGK